MDSAIFDELRDEVALRCDSQGVIQWQDGCARRALGDRIGEHLNSLAVHGTASKVDELLAVARRSRSPWFEVSFLLEGKPRTLVIRGAPHGDGVALIARPTDDAHAPLEAMQSTLNELGELHRTTERQRVDLERVNSELAASNRGLVSLHAELDERGDALRRALEVKGRVVASVSHEFRTPVHSILGLVKLLLDESDGPVNSEQRVQLEFVQGSARTLQILVDDLLDLARLEGGTGSLRARPHSMRELLETLGGTMAPLVTSSDVKLRIEKPSEDFTLETDDGKVAQVLRNLVSNALKFTERGEVRVAVERGPDDSVVFRVSDTGVGIAATELDRVFEEFAQIDGPVQRRVKGSGLGLALSRRLAAVLGGTLGVESEPGKGSVFTLTIPRVHSEVIAMNDLFARNERVDPARAPVLVVEDDRQTMFLYEKYLAASGFQVIPARTVDGARAALERVRPAAIVLDVHLEGEVTWRFLEDLKSKPTTADIPVMVVTVVDRGKQARALGANEFWLKPVDPARLTRKLEELARTGAVKLLLIEDAAAARYMVKKLLDGTGYTLIEAATASEGVQMARAENPQLILLDFILGEQTAFDVIDDLRANPLTRHIPVILQTGKQLTELEIERLSRDTTSILRKESLSRELAISRIREALLNTIPHAADHGARR